MGRADEDLRHGHASVRACHHVASPVRIAAHVDLGEARPPCATTAAWRRGNRGNSGSCRSRLWSCATVEPTALVYMGARPAATTRANTSTSTDAAPARSSARAQASTVAPEVSTSSTSTSLRPATSALPSAGTRKAPCTFSRPFGLAEPDLLRRRLDALERAVGDRPPARLGDDLRQQRRLVEPTRPLPPPVQRHRHDGVGVGEQLAPGIRHPASHGRGEIEPVAVFQGMDELARDVVVAHGGARAMIGRRIGDRLHRQQARPAVERERNAEPLAIGRRDEGELATSRPRTDRRRRPARDRRRKAAAARCRARATGAQGGGAPRRRASTDVPCPVHRIATAATGALRAIAGG